MRVCVIGEGEGKGGGRWGYTGDWLIGSVVIVYSKHHWHGFFFRTRLAFPLNKSF